MLEKQSREFRYEEKKNEQNGCNEEFIGKSPGIAKVLGQVEQVAKTDVTVLILGETGVGKEIVASAIHGRSQRRSNPFVKVNCSALPESLITSELFGHEKGAFTGAVSRKVGRFEMADRGTIFLDEIGDVLPEVQVKLLRVLQYKEFERVGGYMTLRSDFRLVVATNRDLRKDVESGRFRQDLFYRLNVFPIYVPPLRQRKEDIPLLAQHFLEIYSARFCKVLKHIPQKEMNKLLAYDWPGNVRELENVVERGVIMSQGSCFAVPELRHDEVPLETESPSLSLRELEQKHIIGVLKRTGGRVTGVGGAAEILEINPNTLFARMKKLGIQRRSIVNGFNQCGAEGAS